MGAVAKHRAGDIKQPIADRAKGLCVAVTAEALCVGQASSTISARTMMASRAIEMAAPRVI